MALQDSKEELTKLEYYKPIMDKFENLCQLNDFKKIRDEINEINNKEEKEAKLQEQRDNIDTQKKK